MSRTIARAWATVVGASTFWMKPRRRLIMRALVSEALAPTLAVPTSAGALHFATPTARALHDPWSLFEGEPETVRWIEAMHPGEVLWDVGANTGIYALYAAKVRQVRVLAFEPSASTYALLARNIELNGLSELVDAYCLAFADKTRLDYLYMAHTEGGHSMHAFGQAESSLGPINTVFRQSVAGFTIDAFSDLFAPPPPAHILLDVDSIELAVLRGAARTLANHARTVMVEIQGSNRSNGGSPIADYLATLGFREDREFMIQGAKRNVLFRRSV